ncbi:MAG: nuclear transport factor 2 family protein [Halioglobus sp.]
MSEPDDLLSRLQAVEDELAIRNIVTRYGLAVDCGDADTAAALHTSDCIYEVAAPGSGREDGGRHKEDRLILEGPQAIRDMLNAAEHQALLPDCAHTVGSLHVSLEGESATVTGYSRLYHSQGEDVRLVRLGFNRWLLRKEAQGWKIQRRTSCPIGSEAAQQLLKEDTGVSRDLK